MLSTMNRPLFLAAAALLLTSQLIGNNIQVGNTAIVGISPADGFCKVRFDITWENSWRTSSAPNNWDAAWVFVKYRNVNTGEWHHARLGSDAQHSAPAGSTVATGLLTPGSAFDAVNNWGVGVFIHRSADGSGTFTANGVELHWNYSTNGISYGDIDAVRVLAVEMVLVPEGSYYLGGVGTESAGFKNGNTPTPFEITSESALFMSELSGNLWAYGNIVTGQLPAAYPKGFAGFYVMKYSIAQQQYVDFLNTLTRTQQNTRTGTDLAVGVTSVTNRYVMRNNSTLQFRNGIRCDGTIDANAPINFYCDLNGNGTGGEAADGQWIACNYLSWADLAAYLDWSGLRPLTELEYEKACRGPATPVANEYAWGSSNRTGSANITNGGSIHESSSSPGANAVFGNEPNVQGPMRVGVFATGATSRAQSGAGYTGALELSGNLWERTVSAGNIPGRSYTGALGNGSLDATGNADAANWPATTALGAGFRGGSWFAPGVSLSVSNRNEANTSNSLRLPEFGGRGCRLVP